MRQLKFLMIALLSGAVAFGFTSCSNNDNPSYGIWYANALVTVKPNADNSDFYMQLDENTTIKALNLKQSPFGTKEVRALAALEMTGGDAGQYDSTVYVYAIDSILTKSTAAFVDSESADTDYGTDPADMMMALVEDGYLTLKVRVVTGVHGSMHRLSLLTGVNPDDPYEVEFRHRPEGPSAGDVYHPSYVLGDAFVAFRLDSLPDTDGRTVKLKLRWKSFNGEQETTLDYRSRASSQNSI